jgi:hypothetical protein
MLTDPDFYTKAIIYGARKTGWKGLNNRELSNTDLEQLRTLPQEEKELLVNEFRNDTMSQVRQTIPNSIGEYDKKDSETKMSTEAKNYLDLTAAGTPAQPGKLTISGGKSTFTSRGDKVNVKMVELPSNLFIGTRNYDIVGFGNGSDGLGYIRTLTKTEDGEVKELRRLTKEDRTVLKNKMKEAYWNYFNY